MAAPRVARADELAAQLVGAGIPATTDPAKLAGRLPGLLIGPPRLAFDGLDNGATATWRLLLVASTPNAYAAWAQLDGLLDLLGELLPVETAEPASFATDPSADPLPAYALTYVEGV